MSAPSPLSLATCFLLIFTQLHFTHTLTLSKTAGATNSNTRRNATKLEASADKARFTPDILSYKVYCPDHQTVCECKTPDANTPCSFSELRVEELQTFVSYEYQEEPDYIIQNTLMRLQSKATKRNSAGDVYYLNGKGFTPALPPEPNDINTFKPPEYGPCFNNNITITNLKEFGQINQPYGCSIPATVDGSTYRMFIGVNGQIPGPTLIMHEGQEVRIRVRNKLTSEAISIHWHGFHQKETPWMDGVGLVTQPPITPGAYFDYVFIAPKAGTYWYHSHVGAQRTDGLYGALIVREPQGDTLNDHKKLTGGEFVEDKLHEHTLTLLDWQRESSLGVFVRIHSTLGFFLNTEIGQVPNEFVDLNIRSRSSDGVEVGPVPFWSGLINGRGRHTRGTYSILSDFQVEKGKRYRFRLVGAQSLYAFKFSIDKHKLVLIATDGRYIEPVRVDFIIIQSGERFDFILDTDQEVANYWIRAETLEANIEETHMAEAILQYSGAKKLDPWNKYVDIPNNPKSESCSLWNRCVAVNCPFKSFPWKMNTDCLHLDKLKAYNPEDPVPNIVESGDPNLLFFNFGFEGRSDTSAINGWNFHLPTTPYQTYCDQYEHDQQVVNSDDPSDRVCNFKDDSDYQTCIHVREIAHQANKGSHQQTKNPSVNFVLSAVGDIKGRYNDFSHPIHLHGHHFRVVAVRHGKYDVWGKLTENNEDVTCTKDGTKDLRCHNPHWKDGIPPDFMKDPRPVRSDAILKDTVIVPAGGYVVIAFEADNPGYWFMHCHIEAHQLEGMAVIIQEFPEARQWNPPDNINRVGNFNWSLEDFKNFVNKHQTCPVKH